LRQKHLYLFTRFHRACKNRALLQRRHAGKNLKRFFSQNEIYHLNHYKWKWGAIRAFSFRNRPGSN
jgi:hypothetical protein